MIKSKHILKIGTIIVALSVILLFLFLKFFGPQIRYTSRNMEYETKLFDSTKVHKINIQMEKNQWPKFIENALNEQYTNCDITIDGERFNNVAIRAKGNTSLINIQDMNSSRFSFKIEFDRYEPDKNYYGLDKLVLNNLIQDNSYMKDYLVYRMMHEIGVPAPLVSYSYITVNGYDWGLYLNVEGIEDGFLERNYGSDPGMLYKPDSTNLFAEPEETDDGKEILGPDESYYYHVSRRNSSLDVFDPQSVSLASVPLDTKTGRAKTLSNYRLFNTSVESLRQNLNQRLLRTAKIESIQNRNKIRLDNIKNQEKSKEQALLNLKHETIVSIDDLKLKYIDDDPESYPNIFSTAKTEVEDEDKARLINSLRILASNKDIDRAVDLDQIMRYLIVNNFVVNEDSYTGPMAHNYYLRESNGVLSMIPWDYNLSFEGLGDNEASSVVNAPIDTPVRVTSVNNRPMIAWIFNDPQYLSEYHYNYLRFISDTEVLEDLDKAYALIAPYVKEDPTKFISDEEFEAGVQTLRKLISLRQQSILGQLQGTIPSTEEAQAKDKTKLIDSSSISLLTLDKMISRQIEYNAFHNDGFIGPMQRLELTQVEEGPISIETVYKTGDLNVILGSVALFAIAFFIVFRYQRIKI